MVVFNKDGKHSVCAIILLFASSSAMASDDYMKLLEAEAEGTSLDQSSDQREDKTTVISAGIDTEKKAWVGECDYAKDVLALGVVWEEFASYLKQCSLGTYVFYRRLEHDLQYTIYNDNYSKTAPTKLSRFKKAILDYF